MTRVVAEELAHRLTSEGGVIHAAMIISSRGAVLGHARSRRFEESDELERDVLPALTRIPGYDATAFIRYSKEDGRVLAEKAVSAAISSIYAERAERTAERAK